AVREPELVDRACRQFDATVENDAHQIGERIGAIARGAECGAERGYQMRERVAHEAPLLQDALESILLQQDLDALVLLIDAALEQPGISLLSDIGAGVDDLIPSRVRMALEIAREPQLKRMDAGDISAILERQPIGRVGYVGVPEIVLRDL